MAALVMTLTAMNAAVDVYVETPRHQSVRIVLVRRFKPPETPASFTSRVCSSTYTMLLYYVIRQRTR